MAKISYTFLDKELGEFMQIFGGELGTRYCASLREFLLLYHSRTYSESAATEENQGLNYLDLLSIKLRIINTSNVCKF